MTDPSLTPITDDAPAQRRAAIGVRVAVVLFVLWAVGMTLAVLYGLALLRSSQLAGIERSEQTLQIARDARTAARAAVRGTDTIEDCTTPGRKCFQRSRSRARVLRDVSVFAASCADKDGVQGSDEIERCVLAELADQPKGKP